MIEAFARTWGTNDPQALSAFHEDHADLINPAGRRAHGRMEIEKLYQDEHATVFHGSRMVIEIETLRLVEDDLALVDATANVEGMKAPDGSVLPVRKYHLFNVLRRERDRWRAVASRPYQFVAH